MATFVAHMHIQVEPQRCGRHDDEITFKIICRYSINAGCSAHATTENGVMHHIQTVDVFPPNQPEYEIIKKKKKQNNKREVPLPLNLTHYTDVNGPRSHARCTRLYCGGSPLFAYVCGLPSWEAASNEETTSLPLSKIHMFMLFNIRW